MNNQLDRVMAGDMSHSDFAFTEPATVSDELFALSVHLSALLGDLKLTVRNV